MVEGNLYAESYVIEILKNLAIELMAKHGVRLDHVKFHWDSDRCRLVSERFGMIFTLKEIDIGSSQKIMRGNQVELKGDEE